MKALFLGLLLVASAASAQAVKSGGVRLPVGICRPGVTCEVASLTSAGTVQSDALSGQYAFKPTVNGAKVGVGTGTAYFDAPSADIIRTIATLRAQGSIDTYNGALTDSFRGAVAVSNVGGLWLVPLSAPWECAATASTSPQRSPTGTIAVISGTTGKAHRLCLCTYNGTAYAWHNVATGGVGDATTCPEAP